MRKLFQRTTLVTLSLLTLMWSIGQLVRDLTWWTGMCFYIPSVIVAAGWLFLSAEAALWKRRRFASFMLVIALVPLAVIGFRENRLLPHTPTKSTAQPLCLVHWNVFRGHMGWDRIQRRLADERADFYMLSEIPDGASLDELTRLRDDIDDAEWFRIGIMAVWGRGSIEQMAWVWKSHEAKVCLVRWHSPYGPVKVMAVDLISSLTVHRDPILMKLNELIVIYEPDIIVGDFNAPRESRALATLPSGYRHAYWTAGEGWSYTWPVPIPMYSLDQCIIGKRITPVEYDLDTSRLSDHRLQKLEFVVGSDVR